MTFDAEQILKMYEKKVYHIGLALTRKPEDAEDFTQEVFLRLFRSWDQFKGDSSLWTWIKAIAYNVKKDRIGSLVRLRSFIVQRLAPISKDGTQGDWLEMFPDPGGLDPEFIALSDERADLLKRHLDILPEPYRQILLLRDVSGLDFAEITKLLELRSETTTRVRLRRARIFLAREVVISLLQEAVECAPATAVLDGYQRIIKGWDAAIAVADTTGRYITQNARHSTLLGYSDAELQNISSRLLVGEPSSSSIEKALQRGRLFSGRLSLRSKDGTQHWLDSSVFAVPDRSGTPLCQLWIHHDNFATQKEGSLHVR